MKAGELCNRGVITAKADMSIEEAARLMRDNHVGCLVVIKQSEGRVEPVGIMTDRDIVIELIAKSVPIEDVTVGDIMSFALLKVTEDETVFETAQRMRSRGVRRVPVITNSGELAGILALDDILSLLGEELSMLTKLMQREAEQEAIKRTLPR
ncbi:MAG: CBS domain-containing protein [Gammaproteobacteria bacterium]|nr:CBS domain-containing protein [Gammaproteobacteria bacterium]NNJ94293.1 CBS domain-containing protein [Halobacteria archaeon]